MLLNLDNLFEMQEVLDNRIYDRFPDLKDQDNLDWKILALQVELGELANEWRGFKKWSDRQTPKLEYHYITTGGIKGKMDREPLEDEGSDLFSRDFSKPMTIVNPMLIEYVDCLHFILSIGLELGISKIKIDSLENEFNDITEAFSHAFNWIANLDYPIRNSRNKFSGSYKRLWDVFIELGRLLGFTWDEIEQAYIDKNKINHERQENGY